MNSARPIKLKSIRRTRQLLLVIALCAGWAVGQDRHLVPQPSAPPPMKFVTRNERTQLDAARDAKARLKATLAMTEARLLRAEQFASNQQFTAIIEELGIYQGLMEDALRFMAGQNPDSNKTRDLYKRLEIKLRDDATRLEAIRRQTPVEYGVHIKAVADFAQASRTEALNSFYSDTVLRDPAPRTGSKAPPNERPKSNQPENQR